jgi:hypothetical protein
LQKEERISIPFKPLDGGAPMLSEFTFEKTPLLSMPFFLGAPPISLSNRPLSHYFSLSSIAALILYPFSSL